MKSPLALLWFSLLLVAALLATVPVGAQRARLGKVQVLQASTDKAGGHPASAEVTGPAKITCVAAVSETPNSQPVPGCHFVAPGFAGNLSKGQIANSTGAGTITLTCTGSGYLRCNGRLDIPPAS